MSIVRSLRAGDTVKMGAAVGDQLRFSSDGSRDILMVAGATGLAPLRAILEQVDRSWQAGGRTPHVQLFHGARMPWSLYEHDRLTALAQRPWFDYTPVVSEDSTYPGARGGWSRGSRAKPSPGGTSRAGVRIRGDGPPHDW